MYAVTGSVREYKEVHPTSTGSVRLYLIEECRAENEAGGWNLYWYNDGSQDGCILAKMWGWSGDCDIAQPLVGNFEDIFDEAEIQTLYDQEEEIVPAPLGVRYRTLTEEEIDNVSWDDLSRCQELGRRDRWREWEHRLCA
jgi:hypothetical protein